MSVAEFVHLDVREPTIEPLSSIEFADFPETGVMSVVNLVSSNRIVEIANVGNEGFVGVPLFLNVEAMAERVFCQIEAAAWRISADNFKRFLIEYPEFHSLCEKYVATYLNQIASNGTCNWVHSIEERCARWLLMAHDRVEGDEFFLTQEFLSGMLGVTRGGVNLAAGTLAKAGLITYVRGKITILDRAALEQATCECYGDMRSYFERVFIQ